MKYLANTKFSREEKNCAVFSHEVVLSVHFIKIKKRKKFKTYNAINSSTF